MAMIFSHMKSTSLESLDMENDYFCSFNEQLRYFLNAALTCRDFLDVGLDALWEELDSLMPLLRLLPAVRSCYLNLAYYNVCVNLHWHVILCDLILFLRSLAEMCLRRIGIEFNITLEKSSLSYSTTTPHTLLSAFINRLIFDLLNFFSQILSFHRFVT